MLRDADSYVLGLSREYTTVYLSFLIPVYWNECQALLAPARLIAENAGVDGDVVVEKIKACDSRHGYNAMNGRYEDLMAAGVIDPCRVSRCALQNAVSVAGMILTTQAILVEKTKKVKPPVPHVPGISP